MGKNNKLKRKLKKKKKSLRSQPAHTTQEQTGGPYFHELANPLAQLTKEQRNELIAKMSIESNQRYHRCIKELKQIISTYNSLHILSILSAHALTTGVGDDGVQSTEPKLNIGQAHVEYFQALVLQESIDKFGTDYPNPEIIQKVLDTLEELIQADATRGIDQINSDIPDEEKEILLLKQKITGNTKVVRNWGFFSQVKDISTELYSKYDKALRKKLNLDTKDIINLFLHLIKRSEAVTSEQLRIFSILNKIKNKNDLIREYYSLVGEDKEEAQNFIDKFPLGSISRRNLLFLLFSHFEQSLQESFEFDVKTIATELEIDHAVAEKILDNFSIKLGELHEYKTDFIMLGNPVWSRPIINYGNGTYFCVLPQVFFSFILPALNDFISKNIKTDISKRRAEYLEEKTDEIIKRRFPESNTISSLKWKYDNEEDEYETDIITFIDSYAIIVEAKSGKISLPALRGAPERLHKHINELLISPNIQSNRLKKKLNYLINNPSIEDPIRTKLPVDLNDIKKVIRISVTLENFNALQSNIYELKDTGWLPDDFSPCPTLCLADFETLFDLLEHPVQIIHYIEMREMVEQTTNYQGDELDLLGLYLTTLLHVESFKGDMNLYISGLSEPIDKYYSSLDAGIQIAKPQPQISPLFSAILNQIEKKKNKRWVEIGVMLNETPPNEQAKFSKMVDKITKNTAKNWRRTPHHNTVTMLPYKESQTAFCYITYVHQNSHLRDEFIANAASEGLKLGSVKRCLIIAKNIDDPNLAYHFIGVLGEDF
ncbi:hypothetical protein [Maridesulfovibrio sp. FT414]|uniref:hypothetical protein n=1 Tax=Maridesulfovibrio sp. FT414 TaxID=2979469 RepID=UPI003D800993